MLHDNNDIIFWLALGTQIVNSFIIFSFGEQFVFLRRLNLKKESEHSKKQIYKLSFYTLLSYLFIWGIFVFGYLYNTPFLDAKTRINFLQMNTTTLIFFFILKLFEDKKFKNTICLKEFNSIKFIRKLLFLNFSSVLLTISTYLIILIVQ